MMQSKHPIPLIFLVIFLGAASFIGILITPALSNIAQSYHLPISDSALLISIYLLGYGFGQLPYALIADRFGRKWSLYFGFLIAVLGSLICLVAAHFFSFWLLMVGRIIIALGAGSGFTTTQIIITDLYDGVEARKVYSLMVAVFAMSPFIAQTIGGYLTNHFGWQIINYVTLLYFLINLLFVILIPETLPERKPIQFRYILNNYICILKNYRFVCYLILFMIAGGTSYVLNTLVSIISIETLHLNPESYGFLYFFPSLGIISGALCSSRLARKLNSDKIIGWSILILLISSTGLLILMALKFLNLYTLFISSVFVLFGATLMNPNASMEAINSSKEKANASSLLNAVTIIAISVMLKLSGSFGGGSFYALPVSLIILCFLGLIIIFMMKFKSFRHKEN